MSVTTDPPHDLPPAGRAVGRPSWRLPWRLPWPVPAVLAWASGWMAWWMAGAAGLGHTAAWTLGLASGVALAWPCRSVWRRLIAASGFPMSAWALGSAAGMPAWAWLALLLPLLLAYPTRAWRDAPWFPTPQRALEGLDQVVGRPSRVLDAGCGMGHGLAALQRLWPQAAVEGVEWSPLLAWVAAWRCPRARVQRGDMWAHSWAGQDLVYVFQRPESMSRVWAKALADCPRGAWLVSLEFEVPDVTAAECLRGDGRRPLWVYRVPTPQSTLNLLAAPPISPARPRRRSPPGGSPGAARVEPFPCS